ncbi:MAG: hypothetical protein WC208_10455 [Gallionella sp.]|jgi:hypothetical protein
MENLTWACHICKKVRPDDKISVYVKPLMVNGKQLGEQNVRYCNDNPECLKGAKEFSFLKEKIMSVPNPIECLICGKAFPDKESFQKHQWEFSEKPDHHWKLELWSSDKPCIWCGGKIVMCGHPETAYSVECSVCDWLYDED